MNVVTREGLERLLVLLGGDAGAVVVDDDLQPAGPAPGRHLHVLAVRRGVHHQVRQRPLQRAGAGGGGEVRFGVHAHLRP
jgi:hypothetical protein